MQIMAVTTVMAVVEVAIRHVATVEAFQIVSEDMVEATRVVGAVEVDTRMTL